MAQSEVHTLILAEAEAGIEKAQSRGLATAPSATDKATFWEWWQATLKRSVFHLEKRYGRSKRDTPYWLNMLTEKVLIHSVDACMSHSADTAALVPANVAAEFSYHHSQRKPMHLLHKMFDFPATIQNARDQNQDSRLLLMEFHYDMGMDWQFGDMGVFQFWITPQELGNQAFHKATVTFECN